MRHNDYYSAGLQKQQPKGYHFECTCYDHFQTIVVRIGKLIYEDSKEKHVLTSDMALILRPETAFQLSSPQTGYRGVCFLARGSDMPHAFYGPNAIIQSTPEIRNLTDLMLRHLQSPTSEGQLVLTGLGRALAWEAISAAARNEDSLPAKEWVQTAQAAIQAAVYTDRPVAEILKSLPMSYRQLARYIHEELGCSPKQLQMQIKIHEAKRLLEATPRDITSIAMELGFSSSQHFATAFKQLTATSPTAWRRSPLKTS